MTTSSTDTSFSLAEVSVRLVTGPEVARWQTLMAANHYLGFPGFVGERLYQVAECQGRWLALIGWTAAAYRCHARDTHGLAGRTSNAGVGCALWRTMPGF